MTIKYAEDVLNDANERRRLEAKNRFIKEFNESFKLVIRKIKIFKFLFKLFGILFLIILILGSVYLIKFFVSGLI